jgi:erythronate-4-phosphate dehydrogenase
MKIIVDENVPAADELFGQLGEIVRLPGRNMRSEQICDADALIVRSVTRVNRDLLARTPVKFVGTCTIGTDHVDKEYLTREGIAFSAAPGCNANAVVQFVISALVRKQRFGLDLRCAVVGCGNVGGKLYRQIKSMGLDCIAVDPFLEVVDGDPVKPLDAVKDCDLICLHTPLTDDGPHPTRDLLSFELLNELKPNAMLINAGRGEVINNIDLKRVLNSGVRLDVVLDVWASEPNMDPELFPLLQYGSPHIAGYSFEGKINGSTMIFRALCRALSKSDVWVDTIISEAEKQFFGVPEELHCLSLEDAILTAYDIEVDHDLLGSALQALPESFDQLRKQYRLRREFSHYRLTKIDQSQKKMARTLGFLCD